MFEVKSARGWRAPLASYLVIIFAALLCLPANSLAASADDAEQLYHTGQRHIYRAQYTQAIETLQKALAAKADFPAAFTALAFAYSNLARNDDAIAAYQKAIALDPNYIKAYAGLGGLYGGLGQREEAIKMFNKVLSIKPKDNSVDDYLGLGNTYDAIGRKENALSSYKKAIELKADNPEAHFYLGGTYFDLGKHEEAINAFKEALKIEPEFAAAATFLGLAYGNLGRFQEALEPLRKAVAISPNDLSARQFLGIVYTRLGDKGAALKQYEELSKLDKKAADDLMEEIKKMPDAQAAASAPTAAPANSGQAASTKKLGMLRIGVAQIGNRTGQPISTDVLRSGLVGDLREFNAIPLLGRSTAEITAEASQKDCDYILFTEVIELLMANRLGLATEIPTDPTNEQQAFDVSVAFVLLAKGNAQPELKLTVKERNDGSPDRAVGRALSTEAREVILKLKKKK